MRCCVDKLWIAVLVRLWYFSSKLSWGMIRPLSVLRCRGRYNQGCKKLRSLRNRGNLSRAVCTEEGGCVQGCGCKHRSSRELGGTVEAVRCMRDGTVDGIAAEGWREARDIGRMNWVEMACVCWVIWEQLSESESLSVEEQ